MLLPSYVLIARVIGTIGIILFSVWSCVVLIKSDSVRVIAYNILYKLTCVTKLLSRAHIIIMFTKTVVALIEHLFYVDVNKFNTYRRNTK